VEHLFSVKSGTSLIIRLTADWPTPSWEHVDTKIEIFKNEKQVIISYLGLRRAGVALQQITSFKTNIDVIFPKRGEWNLTIKGRSEDWESEIEVT
jgi:hypothetical protein